MEQHQQQGTITGEVRVPCLVEQTRYQQQQQHWGGRCQLQEQQQLLAHDVLQQLLQPTVDPLLLPLQQQKQQQQPMEDVMQVTEHQWSQQQQIGQDILQQLQQLSGDPSLQTFRRQQAQQHQQQCGRSIADGYQQPQPQPQPMVRQPEVLQQLQQGLASPIVPHQQQEGHCQQLQGEMLQDLSDIQLLDFFRDGGLELQDLIPFACTSAAEARIDC